MGGKLSRKYEMDCLKSIVIFVSCVKFKFYWKILLGTEELRWSITSEGRYILLSQNIIFLTWCLIRAFPVEERMRGDKPTLGLFIKNNFQWGILRIPAVEWNVANSQRYINSSIQNTSSVSPFFSFILKIISEWVRADFELIKYFDLFLHQT